MRFLFRDIVRSFMLVLLMLLAVPVLVLAQDAPPIVAPDYVSFASAVVAALIVMLSPIVTGLFKRVIPVIPKLAVPIIHAGVGVGLQYLSTLTPFGGKFSPTVALVLAALGVWLRDFVLLLNSGESLNRATKTLLVLFCVGGIGLSSAACASTGGAQKDAMTSLVLARSALDLTEQTLLRTECGKTFAPPAGACVPKEVADKGWTLIKKAAAVGKEASDVAAKLPPALDGSITSPQLSAFISEIWDAVRTVISFFPPSNVASKLQADVKAIEAKK